MTVWPEPCHAISPAAPAPASPCCYLCGGARVRSTVPAPRSALGASGRRRANFGNNNNNNYNTNNNNNHNLGSLRAAVSTAVSCVGLGGVLVSRRRPLRGRWRPLRAAREPLSLEARSAEELLASLEAKEQGVHAGSSVEDYIPLTPESLELLKGLREEVQPRGSVSLSLLALWELWELHGLPRKFCSTRPSQTSVKRLHRPTAEQLWQCVLQNEPAVISGVLDEDGFPPLRDFASFAYLRARCGERRVPLKADMFLDSEGRRVFLDDPGNELSLSEYLGLLEQAELSGESPSYYMGKNKLTEVAPELAEDIEQSSASPIHQFGSCFGDNHQGVHAYLGAGGNTTPIHCDPGENLLVVISGTKRLWLFPPTDADCLYTIGKTNASVPPFVPTDAMPEDLRTRCPLYQHARPLQVDLEKGDILYLPIFWWHCVSGSATRNMILNWWFDMHPQKLESTESARARGIMDDIRRQMGAS